MRRHLLFVYLVLLGALVVLLTMDRVERSNGRRRYRATKPRFNVEVVSSPHEEYAPSTVTPEEGNLCIPWRKIVFIKTHKTASTTTNTIIQRYGYLKNLTFILPRWSHIFNEKEHFTSRQVFRSTRWLAEGEQQPEFDIMAGHFRYNRPEVHRLIPNAMYITILRDPVKRFESAFGYYEVAKQLGLGRKENPLDTFMKYPNRFMRKDMNMKFQLRNGMMFSLGFEEQYYGDESMIESKIEQLANELDLVMLSEYYDESLLLLKDLLCWDFEDIHYIPKGYRSERLRNPMSPELRGRIQSWNKADAMLYDHFNRTFWKRVEAYGPSFEEDLAYFRHRQEEFVNECIDPQKLRTIQGKEDALVLRENASMLCRVSYYRVFTFITDLKLKALEEDNPDSPRLKTLREEGVENLGLGKRFYNAKEINISQTVQ
ncbi:galactosylceramide sulfotransferase-like [Ptychodera flava]|uniref:galactosylceramide sulfotransferase-like n=1 Tax=Ptychodera flava TaxID=63121 RepID=UPI00396A46C3